MIYHYTNQNGYNGIVKEKKFHLVRSTQSNDFTDTVHIHELLESAMNSSKLNNSELKKYEFLLDLFNRFKDEWQNDFIPEKIEKAFVTCFTSKGDNRFFWETYTEIDGYCIGFSKEKLNNYLLSSNAKFEILKSAYKHKLMSINYNHKDQIDKVIDIIDYWSYHFEHIKDDEFSELIRPIVCNFQFELVDENGKTQFIGEPNSYEMNFRKKFELISFSSLNELFEWAPFFKNDFWKDEEETRLAFYRKIHQPHLKSVLKRTNSEKQYIEFRFPMNIIEEIILGPQNKNTVLEIETELIKYGYDLNNVKIKYSNGKNVIR